MFCRVNFKLLELADMERGGVQRREREEKIAQRQGRIDNFSSCWLQLHEAMIVALANNSTPRRYEPKVITEE